MAEHPAPLWRQVVDIAAVGVVFVGPIVAIALLAESCHSDKRAAAAAFFADLRAGDGDGAYAALAPERRAELSPGAFAAATAAPVYAGHAEAGFGETRSWGPVDGRWHACTVGSLDFHGAAWDVEVYLTYGDDAVWRVHDWAVAESSWMQPTLLEPCRRAQ